jgi:uncharacterized delta-60 repeat protein
MGSRAALQTDGKIVVTGYGSGPHFSLVRYTVDGRLDTTFGSGGQVLTDFRSSRGPTVVGVAIQPDGKIIVGGTNDTSSSSTVFFVERFDSDGSVDKTFGNSGTANASIGAVNVAYGLALQADGKIVVVGSVNTTPMSANPGSFGVVRFNPNGSLDSGFGTGGKVSTPFGGDFDIPTGVVVQGDGKIVVGGSAAPNGKTDLALARYNANGTLDSSFGTGGMVTGANVALYPSIALQPDGRIVLAGSLLVRFNSNGAVDGTFGVGGQATPLFSVAGVIVQADGKIVTVGTPTIQGGSQFAVARYNADGSSDTTFGTGGEVTTDFGSRGAASGVALQSDGKIVAVGTGSVSSSITGFAVARYNPDGSLDAGFATAGKALTTLSGNLFAPANTVAVQLDGKIVVAGSASGLVRYNADGSLDVGFGTAGRVTSAFVTASGVALQADGKIILVGDSPAVARYTANGTLDVTFGNGGLVTTSFAANSVAIQNDGKLVIVGKVASSNFTDFAVARYNADGTPDSGFGSAGMVTTDFSGLDSASGVVLQSDGRILVVGDTETGDATAHVFSASLAMARYNADGSLDATFGTGGKLVSTAMSLVGPGPVQLQPRVALQPDGRILVAGDGPSFADFKLLRFLANGNLDSSFGTSGTVTTTFGDSAHATGVVVQSDGKIIVAGTARVNLSMTSFFAIARYNPAGSLDSTFGTGGKIMTDFGDHFDEAHAVVLQPDGRIVAAGLIASGFGVARYLSDNVSTPNQRFVQQLYWDLLRRPVDSSGLAVWSGQLDQGVSRTQVAAGIQSSAEYHTLVVSDLYKLVLGRTVDASGLTTWVSFLNQGNPAEQLEVTLLGSDEFFATHANQDNQLFLSALYPIVLQRPIDPSGAQSWGQALQSGALSRQGVAAAVLASLESDGLEVQSLYMQFLHRAADPGGLNTFTSALQHGVSNEQVALSLMGSAEYFSRV